MEPGSSGEGLRELGPCPLGTGCWLLQEARPRCWFWGCRRRGTLDVLGAAGGSSKMTGDSGPPARASRLLPARQGRPMKERCQWRVLAQLTAGPQGGGGRSAPCSPVPPPWPCRSATAHASP